MIEAKIIAHSSDNRGNEVITFVVTYPRIVLAEVLTHRMFSRNTASSRAIPFEKMVESILTNPFIPIAWQKDHKGMQGTKYFDSTETFELEYFIEALDKIFKKHSEFKALMLKVLPNVIGQKKTLSQWWLYARDRVVESACILYAFGATKQLCNRLLEPFMYVTQIITTSKEGLDNFFDLRCPKILHEADGKYYKSIKDWNKVDLDIQYYGLSCLHPGNKGQAEIHLMDLAEKMWDCYTESTPKMLDENQWHIPFEDKIDLTHYSNPSKDLLSSVKVKLAVVNCARVSYTTIGEDKKQDYQKDLELFDKLLSSKHFSPFEHCCKVMSKEEYNTNVKGYYPEYLDSTAFDSFSLDTEGTLGWAHNLKGFMSYRFLLENGNI